MVKNFGELQLRVQVWTYDGRVLVLCYVKSFKIKHKSLRKSFLDIDKSCIIRLYQWFSLRSYLFKTHIIAWRRKNVTNATQNKIQREKWFEMCYLRTVSSTLNLFWEAHWLYISWFLDFGRTQPPSPPTSNSVDVTKKKWLKEEQRIMRRKALQESMKREAIFGRSS